MKPRTADSRIVLPEIRHCQYQYKSFFFSGPCMPSRPIPGPRGSLNPVEGLQAWASSGLEAEPIAAPATGRSLCSRLRKELVYWRSEPAGPSADTGWEYTIPGIPKPVPGRGEKGHRGDGWPLGLVITPWGECRSSAPDSWILPGEPEGKSGSDQPGAGKTHCPGARPRAEAEAAAGASASALGLRRLLLFLVLRSFGLLALLSAREKCSSTTLLMSPWK